MITDIEKLILTTPIQFGEQVHWLGLLNSSQKNYLSVLYILIKVQSSNVPLSFDSNMLSSVENQWENNYLQQILGMTFSIEITPIFAILSR